jgi:hypothetical protein
VPCHQLSFEAMAPISRSGSKPARRRPRRFIIDYVTDKSQPQFMAQLDAWSLGGEVEDSDFSAVIPESVKQVKFGKFAPDGQVQQ